MALLIFSQTFAHSIETALLDSSPTPVRVSWDFRRSALAPTSSARFGFRSPSSFLTAAALLGGFYVLNSHSLLGPLPLQNVMLASALRRRPSRRKSSNVFTIDPAREFNAPMVLQRLQVQPGAPLRRDIEFLQRLVIAVDEFESDLRRRKKVQPMGRLTLHHPMAVEDFKDFLREWTRAAVETEERVNSLLQQFEDSNRGNEERLSAEVAIDREILGFVEIRRNLWHVAAEEAMLDIFDDTPFVHLVSRHFSAFLQNEHRQAVEALEGRVALYAGLVPMLEDRLAAENLTTIPLDFIARIKRELLQKSPRTYRKIEEAAGLAPDSPLSRESLWLPAVFVAVHPSSWRSALVFAALDWASRRWDSKFLAGSQNFFERRSA